MRDASILESGFKTIGYIDIKKVKCGKKNCKCSTDLEALHGPYYYYRYWKLVYNRYRQKRLYITERQAIRIQRAIDNYREMCGEYGGENGNFINERKSIRQISAVRGPLEREQLNKLMVIKVKHLQ
jgi:hypothetical protein